MLEIKQIQLGSAYDFIALDRYTYDKDKVNIRFKDTDKTLITWELTDTGYIKIPHGVINYKDYENIYRIEMIIEYKPCSSLPLNLEDINTLEGLKQNIKDIESLDYISSIRWVANHYFGIRLNEFVLFNSVRLDEFGQIMKLEYKDMDRYSHSIPDFCTLKEYSNKLKELGISEWNTTSGELPSSKSICNHCGQRWTLKNMNNCVSRGYEILYHKDCNKYHLNESSKKEFDYIASQVFHNYSLVAVRNEYGSEDYNGCWWIIKSEYGDVKIGWRKRVVEITWLDNYKFFNEKFENEDVTKGFGHYGNERYIHAWSIDKAIEYLKKSL